MGDLKIGSLFSGIGGLELGLEWAGVGRVVWQVECDPFCRKVLAKHWPGVKQYEDVQKVGAELERVDVVCGGFPCQDLSGAHTAGKRRGLDGAKSGLWSEYLRIVESCRPTWIVVENVMPCRDWLPFVRRDLHEIGYSSVPVLLRACDVAAPHERPRCFVLAHADGKGEPLRAEHAKVAGLRALSKPGRHWGAPPPRGFRMDDGVPRGMDRLRCLGNAVVPQCAEVIGRIIVAAHG